LSGVSERAFFREVGRLKGRAWGRLAPVGVMRTQASRGRGGDAGGCGNERQEERRGRISCKLRGHQEPRYVATHHNPEVAWRVASVSAQHESVRGASQEA